jgi:hypothetical protein
MWLKRVTPAVPICTTSSTILCPHGGQAILSTANKELLIMGCFALLETDVHQVVGCPFAIGTAYHPCVAIHWTMGAKVYKVDGIPVLLKSSVGICCAADQAPQGVAVMVNVQTEVLGI